MSKLASFNSYLFQAKSPVYYKFWSLHLPRTILQFTTKGWESCGCCGCRYVRLWSYGRRYIWSASASTQSYTLLANWSLLVEVVSSRTGLKWTSFHGTIFRSNRPSLRWAHNVKLWVVSDPHGIATPRLKIKRICWTLWSKFSIFSSWKDILFKTIRQKSQSRYFWQTMKIAHTVESRIDPVTFYSWKTNLKQPQNSGQWFFQKK